MWRLFFLTILILTVGTSVADAASLKIVNKPVSFGFTPATFIKRTIDTIIVHSTYNPSLTTQTIDGAIAMWQPYNVAPNYAIDPAGTIYLLVPENVIASQAGVGALPNGDSNVNDRSLGIELIYANDAAPDAAQYTALRTLITDIKQRYSIDYILGHSQIAPDRKDDPWNFDDTKINHLFTNTEKVFPIPTLTKVKTFQSDTAILTPAQQAVMKKYSYRAGCPVALSNLRAVSVSYYDFNGAIRKGTLIVNKSTTKDTIAAFKGLFAKRFPIRQIAPVDTYQGIDEFSVAADNTSAFNCRYVDGTTTYSEHSYGTAIDINPKENPSYLTILSSTKVTAGEEGALTAAAVKIVKAAGFQWGGDWVSKKDYQHFSINGK